MANSRRIEKINELIREELSKIILREFSVEAGVISTIIRVETDADFKKAKIFVSVFPQEKEKSVINKLNSSAGQIQYFLNKKIRIKFVPRIRFFKDEEIKKENTAT